ncbi:MAG: hypothetical protein JST10_07020 [Bacteroidetes bacterium]|nr:hypothetical protein [Bacteroidota bacterium]
MKKLSPGKRQETSSLSISAYAYLEEPVVLQNLVERLAKRDEENSESGLLAGEWEQITTSSLEGYANGDLIMEDDIDILNSLFDTCFLFTCIRKQESNYKMIWVCSLS